MIRNLVCKIIQRKTYDILAKKHTILFLFISLIIVLISLIHFGETLMEWSQEKYTAVFSPYSDNIMSKSYRTMLCQHVPIDVVYTWVNGSDPEFLSELSKAKEEYGFIGTQINCTLSNCVQSHMVLVRPALPSFLTLGDIEEIDSVFQHISRSFIVASPSHNITVFEFPNIHIAENVVKKRMFVIEGVNHTLEPAYLTDAWGSTGIVPISNILFLQQLPLGFSTETIKEKFTVHNISLFEVFIHEEKNLAVLNFMNPTAANAALKLNNITLNGKTCTLSACYLVVDHPSEHEDISASRFTDNEELRYSLRSLEKHAPWVRHVFIVTNGQIPYWLNMDSPLVSIVTHKEIFLNQSHLPTFSSPAIECHLHRIPNLSQKFLYLNDDVMFGKDVWPEDFYTHTKGQKVYLSWPVPNCAEGCPSSWIRDGYCDKPCNTSQCQWDGGDCTGDTPALPFQLSHESTRLFPFAEVKDFCHVECSDSWIADRYCDKACNVQECGFDAGDCGLENFNKLQQLLLLPDQNYYYLPQGEYVGYFNLSSFLNTSYELSGGFWEDIPIVRTLAISLKYSIIGIVLRPNHNSTNITITLRGELNKQPYEKKIYLHAMTILPPIVNDSKVGASDGSFEDSYTLEVFGADLRSPHINTIINNDIPPKYAHVNVSKSGLPVNIIEKIEELQSKKTKGILTESGFLYKKSEVIESYLKTLTGAIPQMVFEDKLTTNENVSASDVIVPSKKKELFISQISDPSLNPKREQLNLINNSLVSANMNSHSKTPMNQIKHLPSLVSQNGMKRHLLAIDPSDPSSSHAAPLSNYFKRIRNSNTNKEDNTGHVTQRHLLDTFGESLRHVNQLFNSAFGYEARKVPAHIAHFVDRGVMERLTLKFDDAFEVTSSHRVRSTSDMQFAFSYYYYMMSEKEDVLISDVFDSFDTDHSGIWSEREMRTVLARLHDLPLDGSSIAVFEQMLINCSITQPTISLPTEKKEQYYDSNMPQVTRHLVADCPSISALLLERFGSRKRNFHEILGEEEVAFKMLHNNLSQVLMQIDDLRKNPKKFVCLNDNMKHGTHEADVIRAVVVDFYESLFPIRSQFELSPEYRNRFLHMRDLLEWRRTRDLVRLLTYGSLALLVIFSLVSFWRSEVRWKPLWRRKAQRSHV